MTTQPLRRTALLFACATLAMAMPSFAHAQDTGSTAPSEQQGQQQGMGPGRGMMDPDRRVQMLTNMLGLSTDQQAKVKAILVDGQKKMMALRQSQDLSQDDRRSQMMALRTEENTKIKSVLTADQVTKFDEMEQRMRNRQGGGPPSGSPPDGPPPQL